MQFIEAILPFAQVALSALLVTAVLLQARGSSVGGAFGGDSMGSTFYTRRGAELVLFRLTIILGVLFALAALLSHLQG